MNFGTFGKVLACLFLLGFAGQAGADPMPAAQWQEYRSEQGSYRIEMPGKPVEAVNNLTSAPGKKMYAATLRYGAGGMLAFASDLTPVDAANADKVLDLSRDTALRSLNATMSNERKEMVGKYPARRFDYSATNGFSGTMRLVLGERFLYQVNAVGPAGFSASAEAKRFLDSFAITGN